MKVESGKIGLSGYFRLKVGSKARGERVVAEFKNLITDTGLDWFQEGGYITTCHVGTGNATPAFSDVRLAARVASTATIQSSSGAAATAPDYELTFIKTFRFAEGAAAGVLAEIGIGRTYHATNPYLFSRALILDEDDLPTTLTILSDEYLDVEYTYKWAVPQTSVGSFVINGVTYNYEARAAQISSWSYNTIYGLSDLRSMTAHAGPVGAITANPAGEAIVGGTGVKQTYVAGNHYCDFVSVYGLNNANITGGIGAFSYMHGSDAGFGVYRCQVGITPKIPKDNTKVLTLTHRLSWGRG